MRIGRIIGGAGRPRGAAPTVVLLALLALPLRGQTPPSTPAPSFSGGTQVLSVEVPVQVVRGGEPVRDLTAADFEVWDGRRRVPVSGFEAFDLAASSGVSGVAGSHPNVQPLDVPSAARRHFLFLFDLAFSDPTSIARARQAAGSLLGRLHPTDYVAVATYSASRGPLLVLGFTSDRRQIESALEGLGLPGRALHPLDPLRLVVEEALSASNATGGAVVRLSSDPLANATDGATLIPLDAVVNSVQGANRVALRNHIDNFTRSLSDLARQISVVEGRKFLVFLSEGFDSALIQGTVDEQRQVEIRESSIQGESWRVSPEERYGLTETGNGLERMLEEFRRADCVIQAVDTGGLRTTGTGASEETPHVGGRDSLLMMARGTGGDLYESFNDLAEAMGQMLKRTGLTYVLSFEPDALSAGTAGDSGEYHRLRVELKKPLPGARVVHRPGYYVPRPFAEQDPVEKLLEAANQVMSGEESDAVSTAVLAAPFKSAGEKAYVPVLIEIDGSTLLAGQQPPTLPVEVYVYALDSLGAVHDFLTQTVGLDLAKTGAALRQGGVKFFGHLDLLPGDYSLRVLVRNGATGVSGLKVVPVRVPAFAQGEPALLPPLFPQPPDRWLVVQEEPRGEGKRPDYPFLLSNQPFVPASRPVLVPGQETRLVVAGSNLGSGPWKAEARVLTLDGKEVPGGSLELTGPNGGGGGDGGDRAIALFRPPSDLKPGEYVLRITIPGSPGVASSLRFVVGPQGAGSARG